MLLLLQFFRQPNKQIWKKIEEAMFADTDLFYFSSFILNLGFRWRGQPFRKSCYSWGRTKSCCRVDIDDIGNLQNLPRLVFVDEECWSLKVVNDGGELTRNINQKKKSEVSQ